MSTIILFNFFYEKTWLIWVLMVRWQLKYGGKHLWVQRHINLKFQTYNFFDNLLLMKSQVYVSNNLIKEWLQLQFKECMRGGHLKRSLPSVTEPISSTNSGCKNPISLLWICSISWTILTIDGLFALISTHCNASSIICPAACIVCTPSVLSMKSPRRHSLALREEEKWNKRGKRLISINDITYNHSFHLTFQEGKF